MNRKVKKNSRVSRKPADGGLLDTFNLSFGVLDEFPCPVWRAGRDGKCDYFNKAWLDFTGRTIEQEQGDGWAEGVHPDDLEFCLRTYRDAFHSRKAFEMEYRLLAGDGEYRWINDCGRPLYDPAGDFAGYIGICFDTTNRKLAERALSEAERKYREIFENASEGIFQTTPAGKYIAANPALIKMHGFATAEEFFAARQDISHDVYVDPEVREEFKRLISEQRIVLGFEHQIFRKDGSKIWVSVNAQAVRDEQGEIRYYVGTAQDISQQKHAEARSLAFATLAGKLSGASTKLDAGRVIADTADDLFGWDRCNLDLYDPTVDVVHPMLHVDTIEGRRIEVPPVVSGREPTARSRKIINHGPLLVLSDELIGHVLSAENCSQDFPSMMGVPISHASEVIGLLSIQSHKMGAYNAVALHDLQALADHCGAALNRIKAEESLSESEQRFRQMAENIEDILWVANPEFTQVFYVNSAYERIFGRSCESLYERLESFMEAVHPDDRGTVRQLLEKKREGDLDPIEFRIVQPEGSVRWIIVRTFAIRNKPGEIIRMAGIAQDITEDKRGQEELRKSEERYRDLVENSREFLCTHDLNGVLLSANRAASEGLGYDFKEWFGKRSFRELIVREFRPQFDDYLATILRDGAASGLTFVETSSGERRVLEYHNSLRIEGVATPVVRGMARDITEERRAQKALRESEERYRELFENSRDAIYVHDLNGQYVSVNRAAEELSGFKRAEILGQHYSSFIAGRELKTLPENLGFKLESLMETTHEAEAVCKNGRRKPVEVNSRMIYRAGVPIGVQGTVRDITERKRSQDLLQTYSRSLINAQEAERQNVARELHDEIGQVLTAVRLNLQSVKANCRTQSCLPRLDESMAVIDEALGRVRELSFELRPSLLDDLGLAAALGWYVARYAQRSGIAAEVICNSKVGRIPSEVETACFRIAQEALTNIARHSSATAASVQIETHNEHLCLTISDNGIGFVSEEYLNGASSASALGLRGMQERALAVHGQVEITSAIGKGSQVLISVPLRKG